jgi:hypothetical protein
MILKSLFSILLLYGSVSVHAATLSVTAEVEFVAPLALSTNNNLQFGMISTDIANAETLVLSSASSLTDSANRSVGGTIAAASVALTASASKSIAIQVSSISPGTGYTLGSFVCAYNGGSESDCQSSALSVTSAASANVLIGATLTGDGNDVAGTSNGTFNVSVSYQ